MGNPSVKNTVRLRNGIALPRRLNQRNIRPKPNEQSIARRGLGHSRFRGKLTSDKRATDTPQNEADGTTTAGPDVAQTIIPSCILLPLAPTAATLDPSGHTSDTTSTSRL